MPPHAHDVSHAPAQGLAFHPSRPALLAEAHARPSVDVDVPARVSRASFLIDPDADAAPTREHIEALCEQIGAPPPASDARRHRIDAAAWTLVWERHTEFVSYTVYVSGDADVSPFAVLPRGWLEQGPGEAIAATHVRVRAAARDDEALANDVREAFGHGDVVMSRTGGQAATVATDFRAGPDGFTTFLVFDHDGHPAHRGRLIQKLVEIDTYRLVALLALPVAREAQAALAGLEARLGEIVTRIAAPPHMGNDRDLLNRLSALAGAVEAMGARTTFRFEAARAYHRIVRERIEHLKEERIPAHQRVAVFMERRLEPAMRTCESVAARRSALSERLARAMTLLATRVQVAVENQNRHLLESMDQRAAFQLRLQETVEGLSVIAITYYGAGLVAYAAEALAQMGVPVKPELVAAAAAPVIAVGVWLGSRRLKRRIAGHGAAQHGDGPPKP